MPSLWSASICSSPLFFAGGDDDLLGRNAVVADQLAAHALEVQRLHPGAARLQLDQHQRAQVGAARAAFVVGQLLQRVAPGDGVGQTLLPVRLGLQHDRQLDHLLGLQLGGADAVQHVARRALQIGRGAQLHHAAGAQPRQHVEGQLGAAVVRLVDHDERPAQPQHVGQRARRAALGTLTFAQQAVALRWRQVLEVVHQRAAAVVDLARLFVLHLERLPCRDDDGGRCVERGARDALRLVQIQHRDRPGLAQRRVVRVRAIAQRAQRLLADRLARHQHSITLCSVRSNCVLTRATLLAASQVLPPPVGTRRQKYGMSAGKPASGW